MRWPCQYHGSRGLRCTEAACIRLHFDPYTPFNHMDLCSIHEIEYPSFKWFQYIFDEGEKLGEGVYPNKESAD